MEQALTLHLTGAIGSRKLPGNNEKVQVQMSEYSQSA
jgi:hypothetical protein